jgi:hypothetical protein
VELLEILKAYHLWKQLELLDMNFKNLYRTKLDIC